MASDSTDRACLKTQVDPGAGHEHLVHAAQSISGNRVQASAGSICSLAAELVPTG